MSLLTDAQLVETISEQCLALIQQAQQQFNLPKPPLKRLSILCDLRGKSCGKIELRYNAIRQLTSIKLRFNLAAARLDLADMLNNTLPHEVAHLVLALCPKRFKQTAHGPDWQAVCLALGGDGHIYHQLKLAKARQQRQWQYVDSHGQPHNLSTIRHNRLQRGVIYHVKSTGAKIESQGFVPHQAETCG